MQETIESSFEIPIPATIKCMQERSSMKHKIGFRMCLYECDQTRSIE